MQEETFILLRFLIHSFVAFSRSYIDIYSAFTSHSFIEI
nr:MAG TPA: hypothetical protein [Caudoviricetes sp.]